ncbi:hypothetical protein AVEN_215142-1 [Araneus ventricosus]|uniref:Tc1-like transposase DDE domain-containing protein n=1 Tax=Araneus ventricosus TaxID=182803 RepID=A0A4Y2N0Q1_ARAVE|nr:hypothetical protein AVEN_215142-1 [Araneus ventricosus]
MFIVHSDEFGQFQQDSVTPHTPRVATKWLQEHSSDFRHFHCPPKFSDMNIIEPIWVPCNVLFRRDLHHLALLWICGLHCRIHVVENLQDTLRH